MTVKHKLECTEKVELYNTHQIFYSLKG